LGVFWDRKFGAAFVFLRFLMDAFVFPTGQLELGPEIARGSFGAVCKAKLLGVWVCAKVRRGAAAGGVRVLCPFLWFFLRSTQGV
jgi:hypothetical protein